MKIALVFTRAKMRRPAPPRASEMLTSWTTRDWADLPVHHPRKD